MNEIVKEIEQRRAGVTSPFTAGVRKPLREHLTDFEQVQRSRGNKKTHYQAVVARCRAIIVGCGFVKAGDIAASKIQNFLASLRTSHKARQKPAKETPPDALPPLVSAQTRAFYLTAFKAFCRWMVLDRRMPDNPVAHLQPRSTAADRRHDRAVLSSEDLAKLIAAAKKGQPVHNLTGTDRAMLYLVAAYTGLRAHELASLTPASFKLDCARPTLTVQAGYSKHGETDVLPVHPDLIAVLPEWMRFRPADEPLWPSKWYLHAARMMRVDLAVAKVPYKTADGRFHDFHSLRHTHGTALGGADVPLRDHMRLMRHSDPRLTMRYCHAELVDQARSLGKLPSLPPPPAKAPGKSLKTSA